MKRWICALLLLAAICCTGGCEHAEPALPEDAAAQLSIQEPVQAELESGEKTETENGERNNTSEHNDLSVSPPSEKQTGADETNTTDNPASPAAASRVQLVVTRDFGRQLIFAEPVAIQTGWTVADVLQNKLQIETSYGGSFVNTINGLESSSGGALGPRMDWFYSVNGISSHVGIADYKLSAGEVIWWDYHVWQAGPISTAVIGAFPQPFVNGYAGFRVSPLILCSPSHKDLGERLQTCLQSYGVAGVEVKPLAGEEINNRTRPVIVLGVWREMEKIDALKQFNQAGTRNGSFAHFTGNGLELMNCRGEVIQTRGEDAGVITASGEGLGDSTPLWLVIATDEAGLVDIVNVLVDRPGQIKNLYSAAVTGEQVTALPLP